MIDDSFAQNGVAVVPGVLLADDCESIAAVVPAASRTSGGTRALLSQPWCAALASRLRRHEALSRLIPEDFVAVQCTFFEKSAGRNWLVPIHQDLSIPVAERVSSPNLGGWSEKEGTLYVQPPVAVLEQLVAVRVHLDPCGEHDGPLRVWPGSHLQGRLSPEASEAARLATPEFRCLAEPGTVVVMRPLLLHASSKATGTSRRRVLHFVFGPRTLPDGLRWGQGV